MIHITIRSRRITLPASDLASDDLFAQVQAFRFAFHCFDRRRANFPWAFLREVRLRATCQIAAYRHVLHLRAVLYPGCEEECPRVRLRPGMEEEQKVFQLDFQGQSIGRPLQRVPVYDSLFFAAASPGRMTLAEILPDLELLRPHGSGDSLLFERAL